MKRSITRRIATLGLAAVAVTAVGGTVSSAGDEAPICQTWHPRTIGSVRYQHTWNPADTADGRYRHTLNPADTADGRYRHTLNPADAIEGRYQHTLNAADATDGRYQHTWNPAGDRSDACPAPSPTP